jgi:BirA family transcriptional regulator, biotin operon repressor / biotin---[acetyl-CoA-carboxylase] ligase
VDVSSNVAAKQELLRRRLPPQTLERLPDVRWVEECGSTNTLLADEARASQSLETGPITGAILIADRQTAGKGRLGRIWESEPGTSLTMSLRFTLPNDTDSKASQLLGLLPLAVGLAAHGSMSDIGGARVELKWPNDLMDAETGRKLAGILCEAVPCGERTAVIVGIGVNVNKPGEVDGIFAERAQWLNELAHPAGAKVDLLTFAADLIVGIAATVSLLQYAPGVVLDDIRRVCATIEKRVRVEQLSETWTGIATEIDPTGALMVQRDGTDSSTIVHAADVVHLRAEDLS